MRFKNLGIICLVISIGFFLFPISRVIAEEALDNSNFIRFHVIANSDSDRDQELKLIIRDLVLEGLEELKEISSKESAYKLIQDQLINLQSQLEKEIRAREFNYSLKVELIKSNFPTRMYHGEVVPAGNYLALKVILGAGQGANWWCVLFPPICHGDWVREPSRRMVHEENLVPVIITDKKEQEEIKAHKLIEIWHEYTKLLLQVWSFSESP